MTSRVSSEGACAMRWKLSAISVAVALALPVQAGDHWLSRVHVSTHGMQKKTILSTNTVLQGGTRPLAGDATTAVFDVVISLDADPQGDDDASVVGTNDADQRAYEDRIKEFARAVFQSTNGAHKIGTVSIYRKGEQASRADVVWNENCASDKGPRASPSGRGVAGMHIWTCTQWPGAATSMPTPKGSGYTLAHEWGHFTYGVMDEYAQNQCKTPPCRESVPLGTDTAALPSIMNNQWAAATGSVPTGYSGSAADFLEFSTANIEPFVAASTQTNAQKRVYGADAWTTMVRDPATDPKYSWLAGRTRYTVLSAPASPNWLVADNLANALDKLEIKWVTGQVTGLTLDRSGSMSGSPIANAKTAAKLLVDQLPEGSASVGIVSFSNSTTQDFPFTDIASPDTAGVKTNAKAAINAVGASGGTALYDAMITTLRNLQAYAQATGTTRPGVVYVLTDGQDNASSATEAQVIDAYRAAKVPIVSFAYGSFAPTGTLLNMANGTGGAFFSSPTTLPDIQSALLSAESAFGSNLLAASATPEVSGGATQTVGVTVDSTMADARIIASYTGAMGDVAVTLLLPDGRTADKAFTCTGATSCSLVLDSAFLAANGRGAYKVFLDNRTGSARKVNVLSSGAPATGTPYNIAVDFSARTVAYPADLALRATVSRGAALAGLEVSATITDPSGALSTVRLLDDGKYADKIANDGTYTASIPYRADGVYAAVVTASNAAGTGRTTGEGVSASLGEDGRAFVFSGEAVTENFSRAASLSATVTGLQADDHADSTTGAGCTPVSGDNRDRFGRIDGAADRDCFFAAGLAKRDLVVRVTSLSSAMDPVLAVFDSTGSLVKELKLADSQNEATGIVWTLPAASVDAAGMTFSVRHADPAATVGGYAFSAGPELTSDRKFVAAVQAPAAGDNFRGGGAVGLGWLLLLAGAGMALWRVRQPHRGRGMQR